MISHRNPALGGARAPSRGGDCPATDEFCSGGVNLGSNSPATGASQPGCENLGNNISRRG